MNSDKHLIGAERRAYRNVYNILRELHWNNFIREASIGQKEFTRNTLKGSLEFYYKFFPQAVQNAVQSYNKSILYPIAQTGDHKTNATDNN